MCIRPVCRLRLRACLLGARSLLAFAAAPRCGQTNLPAVCTLHNAMACVACTCSTPTRRCCSHPAQQTKVLAVYGSRDAMRSDYALLEDKMPQSQVGAHYTMFGWLVGSEQLAAAAGSAATCAWREFRARCGGRSWWGEAACKRWRSNPHCSNQCGWTSERQDTAGA